MAMEVEIDDGGDVDDDVDDEMAAAMRRLERLVAVLVVKRGGPGTKIQLR